MRGVFEDEELEPAQPRRDTELTLGSGTLLVIFFGLVLICGLCFGLGYTLGRHAARQTPAAASQPEAADTGFQTPLPADSSHPKPSATTQAAVSPAQSSSADQSSAASDANAAQAAPAGSSPQVRPALTPAPNPPQPAPSAPPAPSQASLMVQIAVFPNSEDADVLVNALRRRGYAVTARREPSDNLLHVRIGPFGSRSEANRWRQKLLNDGYNAIVMP
jgi:cell division septation protein DedD